MTPPTHTLDELNRFVIARAAGIAQQIRERGSHVRGLGPRQELLLRTLRLTPLTVFEVAEKHFACPPLEAVSVLAGLAARGRIDLDSEGRWTAVKASEAAA